MYVSRSMTGKYVCACMCVCMCVHAHMHMFVCVCECARISCHLLFFQAAVHFGPHFYVAIFK